MRYKSQENAVFIAIHPTTYRSGGFLAHGVLNETSLLPPQFDNSVSITITIIHAISRLG